MAGCGASEIRGLLEPFFETGTEGIHWSIQDPGLPGYDGLTVLREGDALRVLDPAGGTLWEGNVALEWARNRERGAGGWEQQAVLGHWVHGLQRGLDPEIWARMFFDHRRAILRPAKPASPGAAHPFKGDWRGLEARIAALPEKRAAELFRAALYPWLVFYSDGNWHSLARHWGFGPEEVRMLLGNPTPKQIIAWRTYPKHHDDSLLPFSPRTFVRLGLLFGLNAALIWNHADATSRSAWFGAPHALLGGISPRNLVLTGGDEEIARVTEAACLPVSA